MKREALIEAIKAGSLHRSIPEEAYNNNLLDTYGKLIEKTKINSTNDIKFDPEVHLKYYSKDPVEKYKFHETRRLTMEELGLSNKKQISPIGVSDPFPLFTNEAIDIMKQEVLEKELFLKFARISSSSTSGLDAVIRGYVKDGNKIDAPFTYQAWTNPKTMELISTMAGVELEIIMDYEIATVNVAMKDAEVAKEELIVKSRENALNGNSDGSDIPAVVGWHNDSYPFVCVLMLSDTTNMIGGETSLRMGESNQVAVVPRQQLGSATVLQGRLIEHIAPSPQGISERITMVTSYRAKDPLVLDDSILKTVKPEYNFGSRYNDFYPQWIEYRAEILKARIDELNKNAVDSKGNFNKEAVTSMLQDVEKYIHKTYKEMETINEVYENAAKNTAYA